MKQITFTQLKKMTIEELHNAVPFVLTFNCEPVAVIVDADKFNSFMNSNEIATAKHIINALQIREPLRNYGRAKED